MARIRPVVGNPAAPVPSAQRAASTKVDTIDGAAAGRDHPYETSGDGIFAVGDVRAQSVKRVASAVGEGSVVISRVWNYVEDVKRDPGGKDR